MPSSRPAPRGSRWLGTEGARHSSVPHSSILAARTKKPLLSPFRACTLLSGSLCSLKWLLTSIYTSSRRLITDLISLMSSKLLPQHKSSQPHVSPSPLVLGYHQCCLYPRASWLTQSCCSNEWKNLHFHRKEKSLLKTSLFPLYCLFRGGAAANRFGQPEETCVR